VTGQQRHPVYDDLIPALATATRIACLQLTARHITSISVGVEQQSRSSDLPDRTPAGIAHAGIFALLADAVADPAAGRVLMLGASAVRDLALVAGPVADSVIATSNRRLLAHLRAGDADAAEREVERQLKCLHFMWRLAGAAPAGPGW
jgi:hypothetical protein